MIQKIKQWCPSTVHRDTGEDLPLRDIIAQQQLDSRHIVRRIYEDYTRDGRRTEIAELLRRRSNVLRNFMVPNEDNE